MAYTIDLQKIADNLDFDLEDVEMLIEVFLQSARDNLQILKNAIEANDFESIFQSAHAIKGSAANFTLKEISNLAKDMESNARKRLNIDYKKEYKKLKFLVEKIQK
ncbi:MAG: Hpt domain-containing protein [Campylobacteraceae bacterium]|nr:Hpt domain-containing protein [Campylobacteraceae bacterium]